MTQRTVLITGASSGIGAELAACFAASGNHVILVARSTDKLKALASQLKTTYGIKAWSMTCDLSQTGAAEVLFNQVRNSKRTVDMLVNCAGILEHGAFVKMPPQRHQDMIDLNLSALTAMLAAFIPPMVERGFGRVLNVASIAAFQPVPSLATYAATKAYVLSLTESLAEELAGTGVTITALCPGITATPMMASAQQHSPALVVPGFVVGNASAVAAEGYAACMRGDVVCVPGTVNLLTTLASRATPKWLLRKVSGVFGRRSIG